MKKLLTIILIIILASVSVEAQTSRDIRDGRLTRHEISVLRMNLIRYERLQHRSRRDDIVTFMEKRKLQRKRMSNRRKNMLRENTIFKM